MSHVWNFYRINGDHLISYTLQFSLDLKSGCCSGSTMASSCLQLPSWVYSCPAHPISLTARIICNLCLVYWLVEVKRERDKLVGSVELNTLTTFHLIVLIMFLSDSLHRKAIYWIYDNLLYFSSCVFNFCVKYLD